MTIRPLDKLTRLAALAIAAVACAISASAQIPDSPVPPRLVNDFAGLLPAADADALERKLVEFDRQTSTQITVVTIADLGGEPVAMFAEQLGDKWGVGRKGKDNGVVIIVKPKTESSDGEAFIASGYGLEGALPDAVCYRIVNRKMIPRFKEGDYAGGIRDGAEGVMEAVRGEFINDDSGGHGSGSDVSASFIIALVVLLFALYAASKIYISKYQRAKTRRERVTTTMTFFFVVATIYSFILEVLVRIAASSKSNKSGGGSSGGGSFGGFGGGSFGGGGGGGRW